MKANIAFALLACVALSAPTVQGYASPVTEHVTVQDSTTEQNAFAQAQGFVLQARTLETATLTALGAQLAPGCCDQGYEIKSAVATAGCCDQGYLVNSATAVPKPLLVVVFASFLLLLWTRTNHFQRTLARWTLQH